MIKYILKKGIIECTGYTSKFTLQDLKDNITRSEKLLKELSANAEVKKLMLDNISEHNSFIKKLTPQMVHACFMYHEALSEKASYEQKAKEFKDSIKKDKAEMKEIIAQIPELENAK